MSMTYGPRDRHDDLNRGLLFGAFLLVAIVIVAAVFFAQTASKQAQVCTVSGKHMTNDVQDGQSVRVYQVETSDCGVLRIEDNALQGVFNSADLFAALHEGQRYRFTTVGWRIPFLSQFPSVTKVESA
ncbi:hypothetical protein SEA_ROSIEPOSIE_97 [Arthrobacter phage RosiePosie]|uniref:Uncharacterized protein n=11 Tax=Klausavirus princesstrina TaxID=1984784 RepID=A0A286N4B0_9CAUD|nr:hypothetical protein SEA_CONBOY_95 [Arthrobacter phage Conboy]AOZ64648.1 hypothetical protein SEA_CHUBSTER_97 [Arthrobacter phage Chubster]AOZ64760.1 hypothetical protein SEA_CHOCOLAT_97 [Arthrobacter phage Chocolat]APC44891.1 hypothetical protein SEA_HUMPTYDUMPTY_97 [Arthrobacter phage HumptyDumpty]ASX98881.1 hypothetical protein SEA_KABREEZE_97 [Arthrobacter phage Kabreeze]ASX98992.1 hypothetical protein SEA_ROSIEPOSIE_97 [Arthrobacter phage RosiePosie]ASX99105.1 hypothetical protein SEA